MSTSRTARECALSLLEHRDRTEKEMRQKLRERDYGPQEIDEALSFLKEYHYIDDAEYAERYIRVYSSRKSTRQIRYDLQKKGVAKELVEVHLEENPVDEEAQVRAYLQKKGYTPGERMDPAAYRKLTAALCRRGFSYEVIRRVADRMCDGDF